MLRKKNIKKGDIILIADNKSMELAKVEKATGVMLCYAVDGVTTIQR